MVSPENLTITQKIYPHLKHGPIPKKSAPKLKNVDLSPPLPSHPSKMWTFTKLRTFTQKLDVELRPRNRHCPRMWTLFQTRQSSCVNARGIPTAAYQVLHVLSCTGWGYPGWVSPWLEYSHRFREPSCYYPRLITVLFTVEASEAPLSRVAAGQKPTCLARQQLCLHCFHPLIILSFRDLLTNVRFYLIVFILKFCFM